MNAYQFERIFVGIITELAVQQGLNDAQLARKAWPHQKGAATAWRKMRNDEEKPKRLNLEEAFLLTQALGLSMADVCGMVQGRMLEIAASHKSFPPKEKAEYVPSPLKQPAPNEATYKH